MSEILVTGAAGFIGSHLSERLLRAGHAVVGLDNFDSFYAPSVKERNLDGARSWSTFREVRGDIRDAEIYQGLPDSIDAVVHLAARAGVRPSLVDPALYLDVNVQGTLRVVEFMRERGIRPLLFASSSSVYGDGTKVPFSEAEAADRPISPYASTKRSAELLIHAHAHLFGIDALCLRFFTVYGPRQRPDLAIHKFARLMSADQEIPVYGDGSTERDYTEIEDILDGIEAALRHVETTRGVFDIVNLGGARTISLTSMIEEIAGALGLRPKIRRLPDQPGDVRRTCADVRKAERLLGYRPRVSFDRGVRRFAEWFLAEGSPARAVAHV
jgi:UDP-glucuronate 4-epimerase